MTRAYGWKPDLPDKRDRYHVARVPAIEALPPRVDHSMVMPDCWDQGPLGACTAFAIGGAVVYELGQPSAVWSPSFLQPYYAAREMEGTVPIDAGAYIRDICKVAAQQGIAPAVQWPYHIDRFAVKPSKLARKAALDCRVSSYARVHQNELQLKAALAGGDTVVFGASVYESFENAPFGDVDLPRPSDDLLGGHAMLLVGYDDSERRFKFRNSWGTGWGRNGYGTIPYVYLCDHDLAADFWVIKTVTEDTTP
jgi:hypothetical protein